MEAQPPEDTPPAPKNPAGDAGLLSRHRRLATFLALLAVAGAAAWLTYFYWPEPDRSPPMFNWYTVDDGATWFQDDAERIPPFEHNGKTAVRLHLYSCDGGKTTFVGYLQKLPDEAFQKYRDKGIDPATVDDDDLAAESGWLVKKPDTTGWISSKDNVAAYLVVVTVRCSDGQPGTAAEMFPENPKK